MQVQWPADRCHPAMPALVSSAPATAHPTHPAALWFTSLVCAMTVLDANVVGIVLPALSRALAELDTGTSTPCPRCGARLEPDDLVRHLWERHRDRKSTRLNSSHIPLSRMPSSA